MANWTAKGTFIEACNCEVICPCIVHSPPTEGNCKALIGWHVNEGSFDGTDINGLNVALLLHAPGHMMDGNWKVALYTDDRATEPQAEALAGIFSGQAGGHLSALAPLIGEVLGVRPARIRFDGDGKQFSLSVDGVGAADIAAMEGQEGGLVQVTGHPLAISPGEPGTVARSSALKLDDHGISLNVSGKSGLFAPFAYAA